LFLIDDHLPYPSAILQVFGRVVHRRRRHGRGRREHPGLKPPPRLLVGVVHKLRDAHGNLLGVRTRARFGRMKTIRRRIGVVHKLRDAHGNLLGVRTRARFGRMKTIRRRIVELGLRRVSHNILGILLFQTGQPAAAEAQYQKVLAIWQKPVEAEPRNPGRRREVGRSLNNLGDLDVEAGRFDTAVAKFHQSFALHDRLTRDLPSVIDYRSGLAFALTGLGRAESRAGRRADAAEPLRRAASLRESIPDLSIGAATTSLAITPCWLRPPLIPARGSPLPTLSPRLTGRWPPCARPSPPGTATSIGSAGIPISGRSATGTSSGS
jgi:hypothetical protein